LQDVVDIQEQFPLFPRELTIALAELLGIKHPTDPDTGLETTMTTDLFVTFLRGGREYVAAYSVKMSKDLDHPRTLDKLSLEMLYWREVGRPFQLLTERELPYERARNFHMLQHHLVDLDRRVNVSKERLHDIAEEMTRQVISTDLALRHVTTDCDNRFALPPGSCLSVAFHLVANGYWDVDLSKRLYPVDRVVLLSTPPSAILHLLGVAA
jgi:hypothetical protein